MAGASRSVLPEREGGGGGTLVVPGRGVALRHVAAVKSAAAEASLVLCSSDDHCSCLARGNVWSLFVSGADLGGGEERLAGRHKIQMAL